MPNSLFIQARVHNRLDTSIQEKEHKQVKGMDIRTFIISQ